jgi:hypothetical protein
MAACIVFGALCACSSVAATAGDERTPPRLAQQPGSHGTGSRGAARRSLRGQRQPTAGESASRAAVGDPSHVSGCCRCHASGSPLPSVRLPCTSGICHGPLRSAPLVALGRTRRLCAHPSARACHPTRRAPAVVHVAACRGAMGPPAAGGWRNEGPEWLAQWLPLAVLWLVAARSAQAQWPLRTPHAHQTNTNRDTEGKPSSSCSQFTSINP